MEVQNLQDNYPRLLSFMKENGYSAIYIRRFEAKIKRILSEVELHKLETYEDVYRTYVWYLTMFIFIKLYVFSRY